MRFSKVKKKLEHGSIEVVPFGPVGPDNRGLCSALQVSRLQLRTKESRGPRGRSRGQGRGQTELHHLDISRGRPVSIPALTPLEKGLSSGHVTLSGFLVQHGPT